MGISYSSRVPLTSVMLVLALSISAALHISAFSTIPAGVHRPTTRQEKRIPSGVCLFDSVLGGPAEENPLPRSIRVERMARLPVWPVWAGVIDFFVGWIFGPEAGSKLEQYVLGGRVCPMQFDGKSSSPFLLLVHHHHNFWKWDAIFRSLSGFVLPEGFPAHPHRGFTTLTYFLEDDVPKTGGGGFVHRDSIGVKQTYGAKGSYKNQAQWLFTGRGMLHEEMFDFVQNDSGKDNPRYNPRYELYQLWINVPGKHKLDAPKVQLLGEIDAIDSGGKDTMPKLTLDRVSLDDGKPIKTHIETVVIAGCYQPYDEDICASSENLFESQAEPLHSDLTVLHVKVEETTTSTTSKSQGQAGFVYNIPPDHDTLIVYVRKGSCTMETVVSDVISSSPTDVPIHSTVFVERESNDPHQRLIVRPKELGETVDLLILSGKPLYDDIDVVEPVAMQGSMVMNTNAQIQQAYTDYQFGQMGVPWDHKLGDNEWMEHVEKTKPRMSAETSLMQEYNNENT